MDAHDADCRCLDCLIADSDKSYAELVRSLTPEEGSDDRAR